MRRILESAYSLYSGVACVVVITTTCLLILVTPRVVWRRRLVSIGVYSAVRLTGNRLEVSGHEHLPDAPCLVAANHQSYLDGPLIMAVLPPRFGFVVKDEVRRWPLLGRAVARAGGIYISRTDARRSAPTMRSLIRHIAGGGSLAVFPEGTFRREPGLLPFRLGAFMLAAHNSAAIVPVSITGTRQILPSDSLRLRRAVIRIRILPPVHADGSDRSAAMRLRDRVQATLAEATGEGTAEPDPDTAATSRAA